MARGKSGLRRAIALGSVLILSLAACSDSSNGTSNSQAASSGPAGSYADAYAAKPEPVSAAWTKVLSDADAEGTVTVYMSIVLEDQIKKAFTAAFPHIKIQTIRAATGDLEPRLDQEHQSSAAGADVVILGDRSWVEDNKANLVKPAGPALSTYWSGASKYVYDDGLYATAAVNPFYIGFNKDVVQQAGVTINNWSDLLNPKLKSLVGITPPSVASTIGAGWYAITPSLGGRDGLQKLADLKPTRYTSITPMAQALGSGEIGVGWIQSLGSLQPLIDQGAPLGYVLPSPAVGGGFYAGVVSWSKHPNAAQVFLDWLLSPAGQNVVAGQNLFNTVLPLAEFKNPPKAQTELPASTQVTDGVFPDGYQSWLDGQWTPALG